jgi:membrane-associated phospholipid phosphatase
MRSNHDYPLGAPVKRRRHTLVGIAVFVGGSALMIWRIGVPTSTDVILLWLLGALLALSLSDLGRWGRGVIVDWLPLGALLCLYDASHGLSRLLGTPTHQQLQLEFDRWLLGTPFVAVRLQQWLGQGARVLPWEYPIFAVYMSHFFMALAIAGLLWRFDPPRFRRFRARIVVVDGLGFLTYVLYPAAPPWMVADATGVPMHRVVSQVWGHIGLATADPLVQRGNTFYNEVAAVPSMHAATSMLILLFFWPRARWWLRALLVTYVLAMAFVLVDAGEHYVFDILTGWLYAIAVIAGFALAGVVARKRHDGRIALGRTAAAAHLITPAGLASLSVPARERAADLVLPEGSAAWEANGEC